MNPFDKFNNQADVVNLDKWLAQQQSLNGKQKAAPTQKGNFFTHLLPTIGGTGGGVAGGALGGAAAGTAILPGVGTAAGGLIGALLGGFAGGAGGKAVENKIEGQKLTNGVLGQGAEQGVLSAGPLRLVKAAAAGTKAATLGGKSLADALTSAGDTAVTPMFKNAAKNLVTQGSQAQGRVAGLSAGSKIAGKELTPQDTQAMLQALQDEGIKTGNANNTLRDIQDKLSQYGKQINAHFTSNNAPLTTTDVNGLKKEFLGSLKTSDPTINKQANILATDLKNNVTDTKSLWQFRKQLDTMIPDAKQGMDNTGAAKTIALKNMRQFITQKLGDVPGASNYHNLSEIKPFISAEAKRLNNPGGGIIGRVAASGPVQKTESLLGKATEAAGNSLGGATADPFALKAIAGRTVPVGALQAAGSLVPQPPAVDPSQTAASADLSPTAPSDLTSALMAAQGQQSANPYSQQNLMADIQRDPKNADKYISTYESLDKIFNPPASTAGAIKPTGQQYGLATGGYNALQQLSQLISSDPSLIERNATPGQGLPVVGSLITNASGAGDYHALADNVLQSLIHLQTGATATPEEVKAARGQLPQPGDSAEVQQRKLNNLVSMFAPYIQGGNTNTASSPSDLISALMASGQYQ